MTTTDEQPDIDPELNDLRTKSQYHSLRCVVDIVHFLGMLAWFVVLILSIFNAKAHEDWSILYVGIALAFALPLVTGLIRGICILLADMADVSLLNIRNTHL